MNPLEQLVKVLRRLPGMGEKSATRLALFLVREEKGVAQDLANALLAAKERIRLCSLCRNLAEEEVCLLCRDPRRDHETLCIIEGPADLLQMEKTGEYRGIYYLLHGALSPLDGVGPEEMKFNRLIERTRRGGFKEIILATNPNPEGEATALFLKKLLAPLGVRLSRIASGVPFGGTLEYTDAQTLGRSLVARREL